MWTKLKARLTDVFTSLVDEIDGSVACYSNDSAYDYRILKYPCDRMSDFIVSLEKLLEKYEPKTEDA